jgi:hypothetical protein
MLATGWVSAYEAAVAGTVGWADVELLLVIAELAPTSELGREAAEDGGVGGCC